MSFSGAAWRLTVRWSPTPTPRRSASGPGTATSPGSAGRAPVVRTWASRRGSDAIAAAYADRVVLLADGRLAGDIANPTPESVLAGLEALRSLEGPVAR